MFVRSFIEFVDLIATTSGVDRQILNLFEFSKVAWETKHGRRTDIASLYARRAKNAQYTCSKNLKPTPQYAVNPRLELWCFCTGRWLELVSSNS